MKRNITIFLFMIISLMRLTPTVMAAENPTLKIPVSVKLLGILPVIAEEFSIKLSADEVGNPMPQGSLGGTTTMTAFGDESLTFPEIKFSQIGSYHYTIWQEADSKKFAKLDTSIYHVTVHVTSKENGKLEIGSVVYKKGETDKSSGIIFENSYPSSVKVQLEAVKTMDGKIPDDNKFSFQLTNESGTVLQTKTNLGGTVRFEPVALHQTGKHIFYLREKKGSDIKVIYDKAVYKVTVIVKQMERNYQTQIFYEKHDKPYNGIPKFANITDQDLSNAGTTQSALPLIGAAVILLGLALMKSRNKNLKSEL